MLRKNRQSKSKTAFCNYYCREIDIYYSTKEQHLIYDPFGKKQIAHIFGFRFR